MIQLTATDRLRISELFPERATISDQLTALDIAKRVQLTEEEWEKIRLTEDEIKQQGIPAGQGRTVWNARRAESLVSDVIFTSAELDFLRGRVAQMDKDKQISTAIVGLCVKIRDAKG